MENLEIKASETDALKSTLVEVIHFLHGKGWAPATSSNYSFREEGDDFWISASGIDKGSFAASDLIHVDALGKPIDDARKTSAETQLHVLIYECFPEAHCVLHSHSIYNTVLSMNRKRKKMHVDLQGFEVLKGLKGIETHDVRVRIPVFENSQDIEALAEEIGAWFEQHGEPQGFLLKGHGLYVWGDDIARTKRQMEVMEFLFEVVYKLK